MGTVIDLITRLPVEIWFQENPRASDTNIEENILHLVAAKTLLLLDRGFYHFSFWRQLVAQEVHFITRLKKGASIKVEQVFTDSYKVRLLTQLNILLPQTIKIWGLLNDNETQMLS